MPDLLYKNNPNRLEIGTLFIQPTYWCSSQSCKNCYVKKHSGPTDKFISLVQAIRLFNMFYQGESAWANQITISIDNLPPNTTANDFHYTYMLGYWLEVRAAIWRDKRPRRERPEIHMTCHSWDSWSEYTTSELADDDIFILELLDMISISNITDLELTKDLTKQVHVNYNHLIPSDVTSQNIDKYVEKMIKIGKIVQSIYLTVNKTPIGLSLSEDAQRFMAYRMSSDLSYIKTMLECLPKDVRRKVHVDGCIEDVNKARKTGFGCSSNVSRFQVWPDGSVSGCPYAYSGNTGPAENAEDILKNIKEARKTYDFRERCHLPAIIDSISQ